MKKFLFFIIFIINSTFAETNIKNYIDSNSNVSNIEHKNLYPFIYFDLKMEGFYDKLVSRDDEDASFFYTQSNLLINLNYNKFFSLHTLFSLEKTKGALFTPASSAYLFKNESSFFGTSLLAKEVSLFFDFDRTKIHIGKISPKFAGGSERGSDIFYEHWYGVSGTFLNKGYALDEKMGLLLDITVLQNQSAKITMQASLFTNDKTQLYKRPLFEKRKIAGAVVPIPEDERMAGNSNGIKSHSITVQGFIGMLKRDVFSFGMGYKSQDSKTGETEKGYSLTTQYSKILFDDLTLSIFGEGVKINNAYAIKDYQERYLTAGFSASVAGFVVGIVHNNYKADISTLVEKIKYTEYFAGFEVPKTELGFFISRKEYDVLNSHLSGFGLNVRYRIR